MKNWVEIDDSQIFKDLDTIAKYPLILGKSCDIEKLTWSNDILSKQQNVIPFKEWSTRYKSLKCKEQFNYFSDTFYRWQPSLFLKVF